MELEYASLYARAEGVRERRLMLSDMIQRATEYGLDARRKAEYWEAQARIARLELDVLIAQDGSFQSTLADA